MKSNILIKIGLTLIYIPTAFVLIWCILQLGLIAGLGLTVFSIGLALFMIGILKEN